MVRFSLRLLFLLCFLVTFPCLGLGDEGVVVHVQGNCDHFILRVGQDYAVVERVRGPQPKKEEQIEGNFHRAGAGFIQVPSAEDVTKVWFEAYPISEKRARELYGRFCRDK